MKSCQVCNAQSSGKTPRGWKTEAFLRQDAKGKKMLVELHLCERCAAFVKNTLGGPREYLSRHVPAGLVAARSAPRARPRR
jgi:hypothetical protein